MPLYLSTSPTRPQVGSVARRARHCAGVSLAAVVTACGGGGGGDNEHSKAPPPPPPAAAGPVEAAALVNLEKWVVLGANPKWKPIEALFTDYASRDAPTMTDPMLSNFVDRLTRKTVDRPLGVAQDSPGSEGTDLLTPVAATPLTSRKLETYQLIILMTGIAQPKAVVLDGGGQRYEIVRGDAIGSEGGRVQQILQYRMIVQVPGVPKPVEVSIQPPLTALERGMEEERGEL
ncbi:MAG: hypothetical protein EXR79_11480 [Myxococcales bacterium]|nr:hypothetical protein [Myxococcales bacterium]